MRYMSTNRASFARPRRFAHFCASLNWTIRFLSREMEGRQPPATALMKIVHVSHSRVGWHISYCIGVVFVECS